MYSFAKQVVVLFCLLSFGVTFIKKPLGFGGHQNEFVKNTSKDFSLVGPVKMSSQMLPTSTLYKGKSWIPLTKGE
jgi:hypothetical protein